jgi:hypothetical protein
MRGSYEKRSLYFCKQLTTSSCDESGYICLFLKRVCDCIRHVLDNTKLNAAPRSQDRPSKLSHLLHERKHAEEILRDAGGVLGLILIHRLIGAQRREMS